MFLFLFYFLCCADGGMYYTMFCSTFFSFFWMLLAVCTYCMARLILHGLEARRDETVSMQPAVCVF